MIEKERERDKQIDRQIDRERERERERENATLTLIPVTFIRNAEVVPNLHLHQCSKGATRWNKVC